ncbi:unnamed protein product [Anisakis simplex]|uniref:Uncharacterized protein n=1 Tax=Anisakis simplex TaxID=6269 RepID=A0A0M3J688_ANISI|nr:unnamed protein product [Anisakis simplex]
MEIPASKMDDAIAWNIPLGDLSDWISAQSPWNQTVGYIGPEQTAPSPCAGLGLSCFLAPLLHVGTGIDLFFVPRPYRDEDETNYISPGLRDHDNPNL